MSDPVVPTPAPAPAPVPPAAPAAPVVPPATPAPAAPAAPQDPAAKAPGTLLTEGQPEKRVVPDKYDIKLPEKSLLTPEDLKPLEPLKLTNAEMQAVAEHMNGKLASFVEQQNKQMDTVIAGWADAAKSDKEFGGKEFTKAAELAKRVVDRFGSAELKNELAKGWGNHPELIRIFNRIGKLMAEDVLVIPNGDKKPGDAGPDPMAELANKFYPPKEAVKA